MYFPLVLIQRVAIFVWTVAIFGGLYTLAHFPTSPLDLSYRAIVIARGVVHRPIVVSQQYRCCIAGVLFHRAIAVELRDIRLHWWPRLRVSITDINEFKMTLFLTFFVMKWSHKFFLQFYWLLFLLYFIKWFEILKCFLKIVLICILFCNTSDTWFIVTYTISVMQYFRLVYIIVSLTLNAVRTLFDMNFY